LTYSQESYLAQLKGAEAGPEDQRRKTLPEMRIYQELCKGVEECGICLAVCPKKLFSPRKV